MPVITMLLKNIKYTFVMNNQNTFLSQPKEIVQKQQPGHLKNLKDQQTCGV